MIIRLNAFENNLSNSTPKKIIRRGAINYYEIMVTFSQDWDGLAKTIALKAPDEDKFSSAHILHSGRALIPWQTVEKTARQRETDSFAVIEVVVFGTTPIGKNDSDKEIDVRIVTNSVVLPVAKPDFKDDFFDTVGNEAITITDSLAQMEEYARTVREYEAYLAALRLEYEKAREGWDEEFRGWLAGLDFPLQAGSGLKLTPSGDKTVISADDFLIYKGVIELGWVISGDKSINGLRFKQLPLKKGWVFRIQGTQQWTVRNEATGDTETMTLANNSIVAAVDVYPDARSSWTVLAHGNTDDMDVELMEGEALYYRNGVGDAAEGDIERLWSPSSTSSFTVPAGVYMFACEKAVTRIRDRNMLDNTDSFAVSRAGKYYVYTYRHPATIPMEFTVYF